MRLIDADKLRNAWTNEEDFGTPDERWRPESEFARIIDAQPTVDKIYGMPFEEAAVMIALVRQGEQYKPESYYEGFLDGLKKAQEEMRRSMEEAVMAFTKNADGISVTYTYGKQKEESGNETD